MSTKTEENRNAFAEKVAELLKNNVIPWENTEIKVLPKSAVSGRNYVGLNAMYLMAQMAEKGYSDPRWITYKDAKDQENNVKAGETGVSLEHWEKQGESLKVYSYRVFNVQQLKEPPSQENTVPNYSRADEMLQKLGVAPPQEKNLELYQKTFKAIIKARGNDLNEVHTQELRALRTSIAASVLLHEIGMGGSKSDDAPTKAWAQSIKHNPKELFQAIRDGSKIARDLSLALDTEKTQTGPRIGQKVVFQANGQKSKLSGIVESVSDTTIVLKCGKMSIPTLRESGVYSSVTASRKKENLEKTQQKDLGR